MRIAFTGKGGSGKTTLATLFIKHLSSRGDSVLAIDGDINQHLGEALGLSAGQLEQLPKLGVEGEWVKHYLRGDNPRILKDSHMLESTPAGRGSRFVFFGDAEDELLRKFTISAGPGVSFMAIGGHTVEKVASGCYHGYTGAKGMLLNHLIDGEGEYVVGDMVAGADPFASSGLGSRFDVVVLVVEPTRKSLEVFHQVQAYLAPFGMQVWVVGNKIESDEDIRFIRETVGDRWLAGMRKSDYVRNAEKGIFAPISELEPHNIEVLEQMKALLDATPKDWDAYYKVGLQYHAIVAESWGEQWLGVNVLNQIDPEFRYQDVIRLRAVTRLAS